MTTSRKPTPARLSGPLHERRRRGRGQNKFRGCRLGRDIEPLTFSCSPIMMTFIAKS